MPGRVGLSTRFKTAVRALRGAILTSLGVRAGAVSLSYEETNSDPNVSFQLLCDEASGDLVDEVSGTTTLADAGTPLYSQGGLTYPYDLLDPGVSSNGAGNTNYFFLDSAVAALDFALGDFVIEFDLLATGGNNQQVWFSTMSQGATSDDDRGWFVWHWGGTGTVGFRCWADGPVYFDSSKNLASALTTGVCHRIRITGDRDGNLEYFQNYVSLGTTSMAALASANVVSNNAYLFRSKRGASNSQLKIYNFRATKGNATNMLR